MDFDKIKAKIDKLLNSPEFDKMMEKEANKASIYESQLKRFKEGYDHRFGELVEKILSKYNTKEYIQRERSLGYEPREYLIDFLFNYVREHGVEGTDQDWDRLTHGDFTTELYKYKGYMFELLQGQGSVIKVYKHES